jgi:hypothetical protein
VVYIFSGDNNTWQASIQQVEIAIISGGGFAIGIGGRLCIVMGGGIHRNTQFRIQRA